MEYHVYKDTGGKWCWRLLASNGQIIATSGEGYVNKSDCKHGISLVKGSISAPVFDDN